MRAHQLRKLAGKITATMAEMNDAQRRMAVLRTAPDRYLTNPNEPPATYAEFLARTSGALLHEPPASRRRGSDESGAVRLPQQQVGEAADARHQAVNAERVE